MRMKDNEADSKGGPSDKEGNKGQRETLAIPVVEETYEKTGNLPQLLQGHTYIRMDIRLAITHRDNCNYNQNPTSWGSQVTYQQDT